MELNNYQNQIQVISPKMVQAMEVLQMNALELDAYIEKIALENPVIELEEHAAHDNSGEALTKMQWLEKHSTRNHKKAEHDPEYYEDPLNNYCSAFHFENSLNFFLKSQMYPLRLEKEMESAVEWIIDSLDENGLYSDWSENCPFTRETVEAALKTVKGMEPAGVGAADVSECLLLQLERLNGNFGLEKAVVREFLEEVGLAHYNCIAKKLGVSQNEVRRACDVIRNLNPHPGAGFDAAGSEGYVWPDIVITNVDGQLDAHFAEKGARAFSLNSYYCRLANETEDSKVRKYLTDKLRQANWLMQCIDQREKTVISCIKVILDIQSEFFRTGKNTVPMTLKDVAERIGIHESTVSRAIRGKNLQCINAVIPLGQLFSRNLGTGESQLTQSEIKDLLCRLIEQEDKKHPLSDQALCELMAKEDITISRRTVAKYRLDLNIPSATGRKRV